MSQWVIFDLFGFPYRTVLMKTNGRRYCQKPFKCEELERLVVKKSDNYVRQRGKYVSKSQNSSHL